MTVLEKTIQLRDLRQLNDWDTLESRGQCLSLSHCLIVSLSYCLIVSLSHLILLIQELHSAMLCNDRIRRD